MWKYLVIALWLIVLTAIGYECVNAESVTITFTDAKDLEARVDSIGTVCYIAKVDTIGISMDKSNVWACTTSIYRSIDWVAVIKIARNIYDPLGEWTDSITGYKYKQYPGEALVVWSEKKERK